VKLNSKHLATCHTLFGSSHASCAQPAAALSRVATQRNKHCHVRNVHSANGSSIGSTIAPAAAAAAAAASSGDLKPGNVLLKQQQGAPFGHVCKVTDFGMSRCLGVGQSHRSTRTLGTVNHTSPELLRLGRLSPAGGRRSDCKACSVACGAGALLCGLTAKLAVLLVEQAHCYVA
jgi:serine/threonine protein kinase